jgi:cytochrome c5
MYSKIKILIAFIFISFLVVRCGSALYVPTTTDAEKSQTSLDTLVMGRKLYVAKCSSCHSLYLPQQYAKEDWTKILNDMQERSNMTDQQKETMSIYLYSRSKE